MVHSITEALEAFAQGEILVVTDDNDRENEGDLILSAVHCTPEKMAFVIRHTSGIVCAPLTQEIAQKLRLDPMVATNDAPLSTAFTVTVDVKYGLTTGISAEQRSNTVQALANHNMNASDFVRPGHVFPLIAREGGVLIRSGHTEAGVDLCQLSGLPPVGVLAELVNDDGTVMRGEQITEFAKAHKLKMISVADLITYRQEREKLIERVSSFPITTEWGSFTGFAFKTKYEDVQHFALVYGSIGNGEDILVRLHRARVIDDIFEGGKDIHNAMERIAKKGRGILVYLRDGTAGVPMTLIGEEEVTESEKSREEQWREIGLGAQILKDLGVQSIVNLSSSSSRSYVGLDGFGIKLLSQEKL